MLQFGVVFCYFSRLLQIEVTPYAGTAQNWELAAYEIKKLEEGFEDAGKFHPTLKHITQWLPVLFSGNMQKPLAHLEQAVKERNFAQFTQDYDDLTLLLQ